VTAEGRVRRQATAMIAKESTETGAAKFYDRKDAKNMKVSTQTQRKRPRTFGAVAEQIRGPPE